MLEIEKELELINFYAVLFGKNKIKLSEAIFNRVNKSYEFLQKQSLKTLGEKTQSLR